MSSPENSWLRSPQFLLGAATCLLLVIGLIWSWQQFSAPVVRAGSPTQSIERPAPAKSASATPSASPSASATSPASASPSPTPTSATPKAGDLSQATVAIAAAGSTGKLYRYTVSVETSTELEPNPVAKEIANVVNDPRSWAGDGTVRFGLVKKADTADFAIVIAAKATATKTCTLAGGSCATTKTVMIDAASWTSPTSNYANDLTGYRRYLVNRALGQFLAKPVGSCTDGLASVMSDQSEDLGECSANPWPNP